MHGPSKTQSLATRGLIFGAILVGMFSLAILAGGLPNASADGTIPGLPTPILNTVSVTNNVNLPDSLTNAASPQAETAIDICNQLEPYSDGALVEAWAGIAYGETRTLDGLPNNNYDWRVTVADTGCSNVLGILDREKLINGVHLKYIFQLGTEGNLEVTIEVLEPGGGIIYLPISAVSPDTE